LLANATWYFDILVLLYGQNSLSHLAVPDGMHGLARSAGIKTRMATSRGFLVALRLFFAMTPSLIHIMAVLLLSIFASAQSLLKVCNFL
jgi:hypothetical protein